MLIYLELELRVININIKRISKIFLEFIYYFLEDN